MAEYIEKNVAIARLTALEIGNPCATMTDAKRQIADTRPADVAPVVHGRWIHSRYKDCSEQFELVKCSQCNHEAYAMAFYVRGGNYCPNCGAKMDGGVSDEAD